MENTDAELTYVDGSRQHINRDVQHRILVNECLYVCPRVLIDFLANTAVGPT